MSEKPKKFVRWTVKRTLVEWIEIQAETKEKAMAEAHEAYRIDVVKITAKKSKKPKS